MMSCRDAAKNFIFLESTHSLSLSIPNHSPRHHDLVLAETSHIRLVHPPTQVSQLPCITRIRLALPEVAAKTGCVRILNSQLSKPPSDQPVILQSVRNVVSYPHAKCDCTNAGQDGPISRLVRSHSRLQEQISDQSVCQSSRS